MAYLNIANFKFGVDTRRSELTSVLGTLLTGDNGHINQGGEFELRKAFVGIDCDVGSITAGTLPAGCFGAEPGESTIYTFGSVSTPGGIPSGVTYIRCQSPQGGAMVAVVWSTEFAGLPFCIASFADSGGNNPYVFYNGVLVIDWISGEVLADQNTNTKLGTALAALVNNNFSPFYTATDAGAGVVDIFNEANIGASGFTPSVVINSVAGTLTGIFNAAATPAVAQNSAAGQFAITGGSNSPGVNTVNSVYFVLPPVKTVSFSGNGTTMTIVTAANHNIKTGNTVAVVNLTTSAANTGVGYVYVSPTVISPTSFSYPNTTNTGGTVADLAGLVYVSGPVMTTAVNWQIDNAHTAEAVAAQINSETHTPDFIASSTGNAINVYTTDANASIYNGAVLGVTTGFGGNVCIANCVFSIYAANAVTGRVFTSIFVNSLDLLSGYTPGAITNLETAVQDMVTYINTQSSTTGFCAFTPNVVSGANSLSASMQLSTSATQSGAPPFNVTIVPVSGINFQQGAANPLLAIATPGILYLSATRIGFPIQQFSGSLTCIAIGGVPPYTHSFSILGNPGLFSIATTTTSGTLAKGSTAIANISYTNLNVNGSQIGQAQTIQVADAVTDSQGNVVSSNIVTVGIVLQD